jgi:hypothetical protein
MWTGIQRPRVRFNPLHFYFRTTIFSHLCNSSWASFLVTGQNPILSTIIYVTNSPIIGHAHCFQFQMYINYLSAFPWFPQVRLLKGKRYVFIVSWNRSIPLIIPSPCEAKDLSFLTSLFHVWHSTSTLPMRTPKCWVCAHEHTSLLSTRLKYRLKNWFLFYIKTEKNLKQK